MGITEFVIMLLIFIFLGLFLLARAMIKDAEERAKRIEEIESGNSTRDFKPRMGVTYKATKWKRLKK
jgi:hypothetical protein